MSTPPQRAIDLHPSSTRRTSADGAERRDPTGELLAPLVATDTGPAREVALTGTDYGTVPPDALPEGDTHLNITRTFCFVDLSGFTAYTRDHGPHRSVELLGEFRRITRNVAAKRGVRVAKWLGDGCLLVGTSAPPVIAVGAHLIHHFSSPPQSAVAVRVGAATGIALLFEGDDYIGEPVNLAAKLCAAARPGEMLAVCHVDDLPGWVRDLGEVSVEIRGVGRIGGIHRLHPAIG
ncbi:MAG: adenylate/guanylate cyclase domain-containing protein [Acidimicrobiales bacterium]